MQSKLIHLGKWKRLFEMIKRPLSQSPSTITTVTNLLTTQKHNEKMSYQVPTSVEEVRTWVTAERENEGSSRSPNLLLLNIEHSNLKDTHISELRLDSSASICEIKERLYLHTGTKPSSMGLMHNSKELSNESATLRWYGVQSGDTLYINDTDPFSASAGGWLEDVSLVTKYKLSDEAYDAKEGTYRKYKEKMRKADPSWSMHNEIKRKQKEKLNPSAVKMDMGCDQPEGFGVGARCEVSPGGKRGSVQFVGKDLKELPGGWWIGVVYDEPVGKNDGMVKGIRYFQCEVGFGGIVRPSNVTVGDFPPSSIDDEDDEDGEEI